MNNNSLSGTVFVVDDDPEVRRALARLLRSQAHDVRTFESASEFLQAHDPNVIGCIILDVAMPATGGLELQQMLLTIGHARPIIFLTGNGNVAMSVRAMKAGACDFLTKPVDELTLFSAVEAALRMDEATRRTRTLQRAMRERVARLTPREREVLRHVVAGRLNKQIAADLGTVEKTIKVHRARVMKKMGVRSVAELVQMAGLAGVAALDAAMQAPTVARVDQRAIVTASGARESHSRTFEL